MAPRPIPRAPATADDVVGTDSSGVALHKIRRLISLGETPAESHARCADSRANIAVVPHPLAGVLGNRLSDERTRRNMPTSDARTFNDPFVAGLEE